MQNASFPQRMKRIFLNETGQMTVFVALIFQVLFVFFAMVINIGLLVHDKINLQNAVDLGAYYGAQRQAEILNEIAHINYQIHQDNKLLAWRYHVLGTLGRNRGKGNVPATSDPAQAFSATDAESPDDIPSVCVANPYWFQATDKSDQDENYCWRKYGPSGKITKIPNLPVVAPFVPGVINGALQIGQLRDNQNVAMTEQGPLNWAFAAQIFLAYKMSLTSRKSVIQKLRANLVSENMVDQGQQPVALGVATTIKKNLTVSNLASFVDDQFGFRNGLAVEACSGGGDGSPTIKEIRTAPIMRYTYSTDSNGYIVDQASISDLSWIAADIDKFDPLKVLRYFTSGEPSESIGNSSPEGLNAASLGFEKNPWCMAYVAVRAKTTPRKPFAPFGSAVELVARSFAQPFGGRVGPWYKSLWPQGSDRSTGARVDPLSTPRLRGSAPEDGESNISQLMPNYSRYPGDKLGVRSLAHQAAERRLLAGYYGHDNQQLDYNFYLDFDRIPTTGDPLAWDSRVGADPTKLSPAVKNVRDAETIAIAPDLFDATYYSIDLNYATNYKQLNGNGTRLGDLGMMFGNKITVPPDLGGRNGTDREGFNVDSQIKTANDPSGGLDPVLRNTLGYYLSKIEHVLTAWGPNTNSDFSFPMNRFGKCEYYGKPEAGYVIPGVCVAGGRVGYSVRIISRDHLLSDKWEIGGEGQTGPLMNPPPLDF